MKYSHSFVFLGVAACLCAQTPPPAQQQTTEPNKTLVPDVKLSMENPADRKMPGVPPDRVVLSIGDAKLTAAQFDQLVEALPEQYKNVARGAGRKQFGDNLVRMLVLSQEGKRLKLDETFAYQTQSMFQTANVLAGMTFQQMGKDLKIDEGDERKYWKIGRAHV